MHEGTIIAQPRAPVFIKRPRLTKLLDEAGGRLLLLVAPAGYGKTTLAREWTAERDGVGWYMGGPAMADVAALSVGMAETLERLLIPRRPDLVERVRILAACGHDPRGLAKAVSSCAPGADALVVVDDYHHAIGSAEAETFFEELVDLTEFRLLVTSRERPGWLAARRIVYGEATVIEMDALAFTDEEARAVLGDGGSERILSEAGGWPAVIGLAATRGAVDIAAEVRPDDLYRYFAEDLFRSASPKLRDAMFSLALTGDAGIAGARELLGPEHAELLAEAEDSGFLAAGREQQLHPLLRVFFLAKLGGGDADVTRSFVQEAVRFLSARCHWDECLAVLVQFPDNGLVLSTLTDGLTDMLDSGRIETLSQWLQLARHQNLDHPLLLLADAEVALRARDDRRAQALGETAGALLQGELSARAYLVAARGAHFLDDESETRRFCELALASEVPVSIMSDALWIEFSSAMERSTSAAAEVLERFEATSSGEASHALHVQTARGVLTLCQVCDVRGAIAQLERATALMQNTQDPFARTSLLHYLSYSYLLSADYEKALSASSRTTEEAEETGLEFVVDYSLLRRTAAYIGLRRLGPAQSALRELAKRESAAQPFISDNLVLLRVKLAIATADLARARTLLRGRFAGGHRLAFRGEVRAYKALLSAAGGDAAAAQQALAGEGECFQFVEAAALKDVAAVVLGLVSGAPWGEADRTLRRLIARGAADAVVTGYRTYPNLARAMAESSESLRDQLADLLARSHDADIARAAGIKIPRELRPREKLSPRERAVYDLLVHGRATHEIAKALFISDSTAKVHIRHIFEKLGVHSRAEAARMALDDEPS